MEIKFLQVSAPFKYLWLKHVTGVDLSVHCARCLKGSYSKDINAHTKIARNITLSNGIWYLCGVSKPYRWQNNFHLAICNCDDSNIDIESHGVHVIIENAKPLPITPSAIDLCNPNASKADYSTCRNWQFANWLAKSNLL